MNRTGGFAEHVTAPEKCLIAWPDHLSAQAASLAEPLANGVHVVRLTEQLAPNIVVVLGAGPIGLMCQQAFQCMSSADLIVADLIEERLDAASRIGAKRVINSRHEDFLTTVLNATGGEGADIVVDAAGSRLSKHGSACTKTQSLWILTKSRLPKEGCREAMRLRLLNSR
jgi:L-iditol 2-dehydrogenase